MLWADAKKARRIKTNMWKHNVKFHQLSYREMEHLRQVWARARYPEVHGERIQVNPELKDFFSLLFSSPLTKLLPLAMTSDYLSELIHSELWTLRSRASQSF